MIYPRFFDPTRYALGRLYYFWNAYDREAAFLESWHISTASVGRTTGNILFDSFLDTWGKGNWREVENPGPIKDKSYFQALGVVSHDLRQKIRTRVLDRYLVSVGYELKPQLKNEADQPEAEGRANGEINEILAAFDKCEIVSLEKLDKATKDELDKCPEDVYLKSLLRMMQIETRCFRIQRQFLVHGTVPDESAAVA